MSEAFKLGPHEWALLRRLLDEALAVPAARRAAWLAGMDESRAQGLKPRLAALLAHVTDDEPATGLRLLDTLPKVETGQFAPLHGAGAAAPEKPGDTVGPYRLIRELGCGGMGSVWLAERTDMLHGRQVALKLPHGAWKRAGLAERLAREREILATLEHPNIARLYDAGVTTDGQPWLALEYVEGERIDAYCKAKSLSVKQRLGLFLQVARAVAHAHVQLVVHRDLKPANILVTEGGEVKLLDFGIAKLVAEGVVEETALTREVGRAFTPEYASPEQILGKPLSTASDVYSLGVVLFELLADVRPYKLHRSSRDALEDAVLQAGTPRPSTLTPGDRRAALRGDLDTIVLKALKREPSERYATVAGLAEDVQRHLEHRPVLARPDSAWYRLRTFARRNRLAFGAGTAVALALMAGAGISLWQAKNARLERDAALLHQKRASNFAEFMRILLQDVGRSDQQLTPAKLVELGVATLERRKDGDDALAADLWYEISRVFRLFNNTQREVELLERSVAAARRTGDLNQVASGECSIAWALMLHDRARALARFEAGRAALAQARVRSDIARNDCVLAEVRLKQAENRLAEALALAEAERDRLHKGGQVELANGMLRGTLINLYLSSDRAPDALPLVEAQQRELREAGRQGSLVEMVFITSEAAILLRMGEYRRSADVAAPLAEWARRPETAAAAPSGMLSNAAAALLRLERYDEALKVAQADLPMAERAGHPVQLGIVHLAIGRAQIGLQRLDLARQALDRAEALWPASNPAFARMRQEVAMDRAHILLLEGRTDAARERLAATLRGAGYPGAVRAPGIDRLLRLAARIELAAGQAQAAQTLAQDAYRAARRQARAEDTSGDVGIARSLRAQALMQLGQLPEAEQELRAALPALRNALGPEHGETHKAQELSEQVANGLPARAGSASAASGPSK